MERLGRPAGRPAQISNPDKVFWPDEGYTKLDLIRFYVEVFEPLKPYVKDRLLSLERCPDGMAGECFYQKQKPPSMPADTDHSLSGHRRGPPTTLSAGSSSRSSLWSTWAASRSTSGDPASRTREEARLVCFDLDPDSGKFADAARAGIRLKEALSALKLVSYPQDIREKGASRLRAHPERAPMPDEVRGFAETLGQHLSQAYRNEMTMESRIAPRQGRVYLDPFRNGFAQTVVSPDCVRRCQGPGVDALCLVRGAADSRSLRVQPR